MNGIILPISRRKKARAPRLCDSVDEMQNKTCLWVVIMRIMGNYADKEGDLVMSDQPTVGQMLKELYDSGWSQVELVNHVPIEQSAISRLISGKQKRIRGKDAHDRLLAFYKQQKTRQA